MKTCAIIVAAYQAQCTILDCVKTIKAQKPIDGWQYELRIGVDGCGITSAVLQSACIQFYYSRKNVGTYIMANSLIAVGPADVYSRFDADDFMLPHYMQTVIPVALKYGICHAGHKLIGGRIKPRVGQVTMTAATLAALGGFAEYRCHCDRDFARRAALIGLDIQAMRHDERLAEATFVKGMRANSLTHNAKTRYGSKYRKEIEAELSKRRDAGQIKIEPQTTGLEKCQPL